MTSNDTKIDIDDLIKLTKRKRNFDEFSDKQSIKKKNSKSKRKVQINTNLDRATITDNQSVIETSSVGSIDVEDNYPYPVSSDDHCETPIEAYNDISTLLYNVASALGKEPSQLLIYDPFYCEGNVVKRLNELGFDNVYNKKEDFYLVQESNTIPNHDIIVTNPPYSADHMEKLIQFCINNKKPCFLLLPNYVYMKDYFLNNIKKLNPIFVSPTKRYLYTTPKGRRQEKSAKYTSPFPTIWYCGLLSYREKVLSSTNNNNNKMIHIAKRMEEIPITVAPDNDPRKKKIRNANKRKKNKNKKKISSSVNNNNNNSNSNNNSNIKT